MRTLAALLCLCALPCVAHAQTPHFDMSPEQRELPSTSGGNLPGGGDFENRFTIGQPLPAEESRRYLLMEPTMRLQGETVMRDWAFYLTPEQAAADAQLAFSYVNAIVVAPEASNLSVVINGSTILEEPLQGAEYEQRRAVKVPAGVLLPGRNTIRFRAEQRHRTDCTLDSTYELWTDIDAAQTYLSFAAPNLNRMTRLADVKAIGVDTTGRSRFRIVAPALGRSNAEHTLLRLSQGLAILSGAPNAAFTFSRTLPHAPAPGEIVVIVATTDEMRSLAGPAGYSTGSDSLIGFIPMPGHPDSSALAIFAPDWNDIDALVANFSTLSGTDTTDPKPIDASRARLSAIPYFEGAGRLSFADLGVSAQKFGGRRFSTSFTVGMPSDFYAGAYGTATILLDAAYSSEVLPGSSLNVMVNGNLATTVPITTSGGAVLQKYPIRVTMRHFRPGINTITFEAILLTDRDRVCAPGATANNTPRFALFGTSELVMPDFARAERAPNLAATTALAYPYRDAGRPTAVMLGRNDELTLSAAATVLGKLALAAGRSVDIQLVSAASQTQGSNAIYVGAAPDLPAELLGDVVLPTVEEGASGIEQLDDANLEFWKDRVDPGTVWGWLIGLGGWLKDTFDLDLSSASVWPRAAQPYDLPGTTDIFLQQSVDKTTDTVNTVVSAASEAQLANGAEAIALRRNWLAIDGSVASHDTVNDTITSVDTAGTKFLSLGPLTFTNLRLVLTNWLSLNFFLYTGILLLSAIGIGLATDALLSRLGRDGNPQPHDQ